MESNNSSKKINVNAMNDRLSSLSDELIIHILSFLPTKYAVATGILAKRWRYLWTNITSLYFDYYTKTERPRYYDFVDRVLHQCTSKTIQRFYLRAHKANINRVEAWVNEAVRRKVYELELILSNFPSFMSTCETLTVMKIYSLKQSDFEIPTSFYAPNLRILSLGIRCPSNILSEKLFQSCPALEDLDITANRGVGKDSNFIISSSVLKRLRFHLGVELKSNCKIVINAPNLEYMNMINEQVADYEMGNLSSIVEAEVDVGYPYCTLDEETIFNRAVKLLGALSGVKYLSLGRNIISALLYAHPHHLPVFYNLTKLRLHNFCYNGPRILPSLLEASQNLKVLTLQMGRRYDPSPFDFQCDGSFSTRRWIEPKSLPECLSSCLELAQIEGFLGTEYEVKLVEYLLMHCAQLTKLIINPVRVPPEVKVKYCQRLLEFPRSSRCQVHLLG